MTAANGYRCICIDPPWNEQGGGKIKRGADRHYPLLKTTDIIRVIIESEAWRPDPTGCHIWLWVTNNHLEDGLFVLRALGAKYITNLVWVKPSFGLGRYLRGQHELLLLGRLGPYLAPLNRNVPSRVVASKGRHSEKPQEVFDAIECVSPGPRMEMFARASRPGWSAWGDEVEGRGNH